MKQSIDFATSRSKKLNERFHDIIPNSICILATWFSLFSPAHVMVLCVICISTPDIYISSSRHEKYDIISMFRCCVSSASPLLTCISTARHEKYDIISMLRLCVSSASPLLTYPFQLLDMRSMTLSQC